MVVRSNFDYTTHNRETNVMFVHFCDPAKARQTPPRRTNPPAGPYQAATDRKSKEERYPCASGRSGQIVSRCTQPASHKRGEKPTSPGTPCQPAAKIREKPTPSRFASERNVCMYVAAATTESQPEKNASSVGPARQRGMWWSPSTPAYLQPTSLVCWFICVRRQQSAIYGAKFSSALEASPLSVGAAAPPGSTKKTRDLGDHQQQSESERAQYRPAKLVRKKTPPRTSR